MSNDNHDVRYFYDEDISRILGITLDSLRNKVSLGDPLPPHINLPQSRTRLWPKDDFHEWVGKFKQVSDASPVRDKNRSSRRRIRRRSDPA